MVVYGLSSRPPPRQLIASLFPSAPSPFSQSRSSSVSAGFPFIRNRVSRKRERALSSSHLPLCVHFLSRQFLEYIYIREKVSGCIARGPEENALNRLANNTRASFTGRTRNLCATRSQGLRCRRLSLTVNFNCSWQPVAQPIEYRCRNRLFPPVFRSSSRYEKI